MKERPILMKGAMVRAILEGRKTQTRRIAKYRDGITVHANGQVLARGGWLTELCCPYGVPGDHLWVKETFAEGCDPRSAKDLGRSNYFYRATDGEPPAYMHPFRWKPSIFLPRAASRITLEIESVRVERIIEITAEDCIAEGIYQQGGQWIIDGSVTGLGWMQPEGAYRELWESINGIGSWDLNPWVWVIQFRRITP